MDVDGPTAAVIVSAVLSAGGTIIVALVKFVPQRQSTKALADSEAKCHRRMSSLETRVAVIETNYANFGRRFAELRKEFHESRQEVRLLAGNHRRDLSA